MRDRVCPIEECAATVRFDAAVVEVTPRYRLHDLDEVDEFATCPECDAAVAGFYPEDAEDDGVELILDIDDDGADEETAGGADGPPADGAGGSREANGDGGFDAPSDDFDDPDEVLDEAAGDDEDGYEPVFGSTDDE